MSTPMDNSHTDRGIDVVIDASASDDDEFGTLVLTTIADELGTDPASLPPLRDSIDPDVLNSFFQAGGESAKALSFEYLCYDVVVTDDGVIELRTRA
ncbi:HalOD1 output domain-containing protein [Halomicrobium zhouii]|nr:HalOD1 output domain-containing protein [Halomicrobium zhouii]